VVDQNSHDHGLFAWRDTSANHVLRPSGAFAAPPKMKHLLLMGKRRAAGTISCLVQFLRGHLAGHLRIKSWCEQDVREVFVVPCSEQALVFESQLY
jgi:hypothetical protein